jgi:hypothetical protein
MPLRIIVLLVIAVPAAVLGYNLAVAVLTGLQLPAGIRDLALLFLPLFVGGLFALPFIAPFFDYKAKEALANRPSADPDRTADPDRPADPRG